MLGVAGMIAKSVGRTIGETGCEGKETGALNPLTRLNQDGRRSGVRQVNHVDQIVGSQIDRAGQEARTLPTGAKTLIEKVLVSVDPLPFVGGQVEVVVGRNQNVQSSGTIQID